MRSHFFLGTSVAVAFGALTAPAALAEVNFGKTGEKVSLIVGYQPYYT